MKFIAIYHETHNDNTTHPVLEVETSYYETCSIILTEANIKALSTFIEAHFKGQFTDRRTALL